MSVLQFVKKLAIIIAAVLVLAACQSPVFTYDEATGRWIEYEPETVTVTIIIE